MLFYAAWLSYQKNKVVVTHTKEKTTAHVHQGDGSARISISLNKASVRNCRKSAFHRNYITKIVNGAIFSLDYPKELPWHPGIYLLCGRPELGRRTANHTIARHDFALQCDMTCLKSYPSWSRWQPREKVTLTRYAMGSQQVEHVVLQLMMLKPEKSQIPAIKEGGEK